MFLNIKTLLDNLRDKAGVLDFFVVNKSHEKTKSNNVLVCLQLSAANPLVTIEHVSLKQLTNI